MAKGILYIMETIVPGLIKIGKTKTDQFKNRMYILEHNGYCNVTGLQRAFAIEVDDYDEKEQLLHTIFEKSRVDDTELFAVDVNVVIQLLSSFEGQMKYPTDKTLKDVFNNAHEKEDNERIPDGIYTFQKKKKADNNKLVSAKACIEDGNWTILKDSILGIAEGAGVTKNAKAKRLLMPIDEHGKLLEDVNLGKCAPSFVGIIVLNAADDGWNDWKDKNGNPIDIYRKKFSADDD